MSNPKILSGTHYTLLAGDNNIVIGFTSSSAISMVIQPGMPPTYSVRVYQLGTGNITPTGTAGVAWTGASASAAVDDLLWVNAYEQDKFIVSRLPVGG